MSLGFMQLVGGKSFNITSNGNAPITSKDSVGDEMSRGLAFNMAGNRGTAAPDSTAQRDKVQDAWANFGKPNGAEFLTSLSASSNEKDRLNAGKGALERPEEIAKAASIASNSQADFINKARERERALNEAKFEFEKTQVDKTNVTDENRYRDAQYEKQIAAANANSKENAAIGRSQFGATSGGSPMRGGAASEMIQAVASSNQPSADERANAAQMTKDDQDRQQMQFDRRKQMQMQDEDRVYSKSVNEADRAIARSQLAMENSMTQQQFYQRQNQSSRDFELNSTSKSIKNKLDKGMVNPTIDSLTIANQGARSQQAMQKEEFSQRMRRMT